jgi:hypothetical protein
MSRAGYGVGWEAKMSTRDWLGVRLLKIASIYLVVGLLLGLWVAVRKDFAPTSVHSHLGLLGWTTMALTGLVYLVVPRCAGSPLATAHFWLHNLGLPVMMGSLAAERMGAAGVEPAIGLGSVLVIAGLLLFTLNVLRNARPQGTPDRRGGPAAGV